MSSNKNVPPPASSLDLTEALEAVVRVVWEEMRGPTGLSWEEINAEMPHSAHALREDVLPIVEVVATVVERQVRDLVALELIAARVDGA